MNAFLFFNIIIVCYKLLPTSGDVLPYTYIPSMYVLLSMVKVVRSSFRRNSAAGREAFEKRECVKNSIAKARSLKRYQTKPNQAIKPKFLYV